MTTKFYTVRIPIDRKGSKRWWLRIGSATAMDTKDGPGLAVTLHTLPTDPNWNGECYIYPLVPGVHGAAKEAEADPA